jgi:hypothetical protein
MVSRSNAGTFPGLGVRVFLAVLPVRRLLLPKTEQQVYFWIDEALDRVVIHTVWGARRGQGPKL